VSGGECRPSKDFVRHIVNHILAEIADRVPAAVFNELRNAFSRAEDKYRFAVFGGDPSRIAEFLDSDDWRDLSEYARSVNVEWVLARILEELANAYEDDCPMVAEKARRIAEELKASSEGARQPLDVDTVYRALRMRGFKVEKSGDTIVVEGTNFKARVEVIDGVLHYEACREGKATTIEGLEARLRKIGEI